MSPIAPYEPDRNPMNADARDGFPAAVRGDDRHGLADRVPVLLWCADREGRRVCFNAAWLAFTGRSTEDEQGDRWTAGVAEADRPRAMAAMHEARDHRRPYEVEYRLRRHDGELRWMLEHGVPCYGRNGAYEGYAGSCTDVTDYKRGAARLVDEVDACREEGIGSRAAVRASAAKPAHPGAMPAGGSAPGETDELRHLSHVLLRRTEEDKARLARELHDDLGSALTAINIDLGMLKVKLKDVAPELVPTLEQTATLVAGTTRLKRRIMESLRPSILDAMGLAFAIDSLGTEFERRTGVRTTRVVPTELETLDRALAIAVYRVAQEALSNAEHFAHPHEIEIRLARTESGLRLTVRDDGETFRPSVGVEDACAIAQMRERVRAVGGRLAIGPGDGGHGTRVQADVPLPSARDQAASDAA